MNTKQEEEEGGGGIFLPAWTSLLAGLCGLTAGIFISKTLCSSSSSSSSSCSLPAPEVDFSNAYSIKSKAYDEDVLPRSKEKKNVAVVTGGSRGIGKAISLRLAITKAFKVVIVYGRSKQSAEAVRKEIMERGGEAMVLQCDLSSTKASSGLMARAARLYPNSKVPYDCSTMRKEAETFHAIYL